MLSPDHAYAAVQLKINLWEQEVHDRQRRQQIAAKPAWWQRWTGNGLIYLGAWLMRRGKQVVEQPPREDVPVSG